MPDLGLRQLKREWTRRAILEAAARLFLEKGYEETTVGEIAEAALVSKKTVFNHFGNKRELAFAGAAEGEPDPVAALRDRPAGTSPLDAFRRLCHDQGRYLAEPGSGSDPREAVLPMIDSSPALRARATQQAAQLAATVADRLREELGAGPGDLWPTVAGWTLVGAQRILLRRLRELRASGAPLKQVERDYAQAVDDVFDHLSDGFMV